MCVMDSASEFISYTPPCSIAQNLNGEWPELMVSPPHFFRPGAPTPGSPEGSPGPTPPPADSPGPLSTEHLPQAGKRRHQALADVLTAPHRFLSFKRLIPVYVNIFACVSSCLFPVSRDPVRCPGCIPSAPHNTWGTGSVPYKQQVKAQMND